MKRVIAFCSLSGLVFASHLILTAVCIPAREDVVSWLLLFTASSAQVGRGAERAVMQPGTSRSNPVRHRVPRRCVGGVSVVCVVQYIKRTRCSVNTMSSSCLTFTRRSRFSAAPPVGQSQAAESSGRSGPTAWRVRYSRLSHAPDVQIRRAAVRNTLPRNIASTTAGAGGEVVDARRGLGSLLNVLTPSEDDHTTEAAARPHLTAQTGEGRRRVSCVVPWNTEFQLQENTRRRDAGGTSTPATRAHPPRLLSTASLGQRSLQCRCFLCVHDVSPAASVPSVWRYFALKRC